MASVLMIFLVPALESTALAYQCKSPAPTHEAYLSSAAVFSGKVIKIEEIQRASFRYKVTFEIKRLWKGNASQTTVWMDHLGGTGYGFCDLEIKEGEHYLVYAASDQQGHLTVKLTSRGIGFCNRVLLLSSAGEDLSALEKLTRNPLKR